MPPPRRATALYRSRPPPRRGADPWRRPRARAASRAVREWCSTKAESSLARPEISNSGSRRRKVACGRAVRRRACAEDADDGAFDTARTDDVDGYAEQVDHVDESPGRLQGSAVGVQLQLDGRVTEGVKSHELRRDPAGEGAVQCAPAQHDAALEEPFLQPAAGVVLVPHRFSLSGPRALRQSRCCSRAAA